MVVSFQGNLGAIDDKYDVAISTASDALDFIIVDNMTTAMKGIEFLKKNNVGMATFIALDKMEKWKNHCNQTLKTSVGLSFSLSVRDRVYKSSGYSNHCLDRKMWST